MHKPTREKILNLYMQLRNLKNINNNILALSSSLSEYILEGERVLRFDTQYCYRKNPEHLDTFATQDGTVFIPFDGSLETLDKNLHTLLDHSPYDHFPNIKAYQFRKRHKDITAIVKKEQHRDSIIISLHVNKKNITWTHPQTSLEKKIEKTQWTEHEKISILHTVQKHRILEDIIQSYEDYKQRFKNLKTQIPEHTVSWHQYGYYKTSFNHQSTPHLQTLSTPITLHQDAECLTKTLHTLLLYYNKIDTTLPFTLTPHTENGQSFAIMNSHYLMSKSITIPFTNLNLMVDTIRRIWGQHYDPKMRIFRNPERIETRRPIKDDHTILILSNRNNKIHISLTHRKKFLAENERKEITKNYKDDIQKAHIEHKKACFIDTTDIERTLPEGEKIITFDWSKF